MHYCASLKHEVREAAPSRSYIAAAPSRSYIASYRGLAVISEVQKCRLMSNLTNLESCVERS